MAQTLTWTALSLRFLMEGRSAQQLNNAFQI